MDLTDWLLCLGTAAAFGFAFWILLPPYGWIAGIAVAGLMLYRAKKKRDDLK
ncbi:MAG TPA: hypothetical protein PKJ76_06035 [Flexilinea sp.]|nr:hypothetical protein [Flexilinea sp.]